MPAINKVKFFFPYKTSLDKRSGLKKFVEKIFRVEGHRLAGLNIIYCSDTALLTINKEYLGHDYYTDIVTFPLTPRGLPIQAEIYISVERVIDNARHLGVSFNSEIHRVIFHGVLHLCGYRDKDPHQIKKMRQMEDYYLNQYFRRRFP
jgi:rRNA maturation RNase YbeY